MTIYYESFVDPSCCSRISRATRLFITTRTSSSTNISSEPPPPSPFVSTVFTLKQNRMDLNCFSIVYMTIDIDVHINLYYFRPDDVIVKDSRESKYIIVVKAVC